MRSKLTVREKVNAKSGMSVKNLDYVNGVTKFDCVAIGVTNVVVDGKEVENAVFITTDGTAINTISNTILDSVADIIGLIDSGEISEDEVLTITINERTSNAGRKFYMIEI